MIAISLVGVALTNGDRVDKDRKRMSYFLRALPHTLGVTRAASEIPAASMSIEPSKAPATPTFQAPLLPVSAPFQPFSTIESNQLNSPSRGRIADNSPPMSPPSTVDMSFFRVLPGTSFGGVYRPADESRRELNDPTNAFEWSLVFFRLKCLENTVKSLDKLLENDELYEAAELFAGSLGADGKPQELEMKDEGADDEFDEENLVGGKGTILSNLQLLRGWKKYLKDPDDVEMLCVGLEEVLDFTEEDWSGDFATFMEEKEDELKGVLAETANLFIPEFILSEDFQIFYEDTPAGKQVIELDSEVGIIHSNLMISKCSIDLDNQVPKVSSQVQDSDAFISKEGRRSTICECFNAEGVRAHVRLTHSSGVRPRLD